MDHHGNGIKTMFVWGIEARSVKSINLGSIMFESGVIMPNLAEFCVLSLVDSSTINRQVSVAGCIGDKRKMS
jgi:hypothetical protein